MGEKSSDWYVVPLCNGCHRQQHEAGELKFYHPMGIGWAVAIAQALYIYRDNPEIQAQIIEANRNTWGNR